MRWPLAELLLSIKLGTCFLGNCYPATRVIYMKNSFQCCHEWYLEEMEYYATPLSIKAESNKLQLKNFKFI